MLVGDSVNSLLLDLLIGCFVLKRCVKKSRTSKHDLKDKPPDSDKKMLDKV